MRPQAPPLKTQGIKTRLTPFIASYIDWDWRGRWVEPFLGSGAALLNISPPRRRCRRFLRRAHQRNGVKSIAFPYDEYAAHWVIGFVYRRVAVDAGAANRMYTISELAPEPAPFADVSVFIQEKLRIAGDRAGSGNTANIGSITGTMSDFQQGNGVFQSESEFLAYWRGYGRTAAERARRYRNIREFRVMHQCQTAI